MTKHVLQKPPAASFEKVGITGFIFPTTDLTIKTEFVIIETETGHETSIVENECDFCYYVLSGSGFFIIDGEQEPCTEGDLVVIPAGSEFTYRGKLKMLLNVTPPFYPEQEETVPYQQLQDQVL
jgi:mannose-6-phosphate isomerase-like protein (cupin superfamily)